MASGTVDRDRQIWDKYFAHSAFADRNISSIKASEIIAFYKSWTAGGQITRSTLGKIKSILNCLYDYAIERDLVEQNLARNISTKRLKCAVNDNSYKVYSEADRTTLLDYLSAISPTIYSCGIELMFCLDVRIGELSALKWTDYDERKKTIHICREIVLRRNDSGKNVPTEMNFTKSGEGCYRTLPITNRAQAALFKLKRLNPFGKYILINQAGNSIDTNKFNKYLKKYCYAAGITYYSSHKIRFYAVTAQAKAGLDLPTIMQNSGHRCKSTTLGYIRHAANECVNNEHWGEIFD